MSVGADRRLDPRWRLAVLAPLLVAAGLYLPGIGQRILYIGDEARYALLARSMVETGDWLVPRIDAEVHLEKSPLFIWTIAALSLPGGEVTEMTAVLPAALSGIAGVGATPVLGRRLFGTRAGLLSAFVLATAWGYFWYARMALADMMVTSFAIAAAAAFAPLLTSTESRPLPMAICWSCLGLGLAAKGPLGLMPLIPFITVLVWEHGRRGLVTLRPVMGVTIVALISAAWVLPFALSSGESYFHSVILGDYVGRVSAAGTVEPRSSSPWGRSAPAFSPGHRSCRPRLRHGWRAEDLGVRRAVRFLVFWVMTYATVITLLPHKRDRYLLATYPILAILVGWLWDRWADRALPEALRLHAWIWGAMAVALAGLVLFPLRARTELTTLLSPSLPGRIVVVGLLLLTAVGAVVSARRRPALAMFVAICAPSVLLLAQESHVYVAEHNRLFDIKSFAQRLVARTDPSDQLVTYRYQHLALEFYARRPVLSARTPNQVRTLLADGRPLYVIAEDREWQSLAEATGRPWGIVDRAQIAARTLIVGTPTTRPRSRERDRRRRATTGRGSASPAAGTRCRSASLITLRST